MYMLALTSLIKPLPFIAQCDCNKHILIGESHKDGADSLLQAQLGCIVIQIVARQLYSNMMLSVM